MFPPLSIIPACHLSPPLLFSPVFNISLLQSLNFIVSSSSLFFSPPFQSFHLSLLSQFPVYLVSIFSDTYFFPSFFVCNFFWFNCDFFNFFIYLFIFFSHAVLPLTIFIVFYFIYISFIFSSLPAPPFIHILPPFPPLPLLFFLYYYYSPKSEPRIRNFPDPSFLKLSFFPFFLSFFILSTLFSLPCILSFLLSI